MTTPFDTLCSKLICSVTTFYTEFDEDMNSVKMKNMQKASKDIKEYISNDDFASVACDLVKDIIYEINLIYIFWTPNRHSDRMLKLLRASDKLRVYMKGDFETLCEMEKEDQMNHGDKYGGISL